MNTFWTYFWPIAAAAMVIGAIGGLVGFRRKKVLPFIVAALLALGWVVAWHGPLGAADRFTRVIERQSHEALIYYEVANGVTAHLHQGPLTRRLILVGGASLDNWQRGELVRLFSQLPGVSNATWSESDAGLPLILEGAIAAVGGFLFGLGLAYLLELRRRYNSQWSW